MNGDHLATCGGVHTHFVEEGSGPPLVLLHGFSGSIETMAGLAARLVPSHTVLRMDLIGHGYSEKPADAGAYTMDVAIAQVLDLVQQRFYGPADLIGYSMGARVGLAAALTAPELLRSIVLVGGTAGIADPAARAQRQRADEELAARIERNGIAWFAQEWMTKPFFVTQARLGRSHLAAARAQRMENDAHALANSLRGMGTGTQPSYWHMLDRLQVPLLFVAGEEDRTFMVIGEQMVAAVPAGVLAVVPGVGHAAHIEAEPEVAEAVEHFLTIDRSGPFQ
ncbi:MAG: 2-succinyl-6-hydroxy-2,4-cyclohexadiene-1-carboxylate synthase [Acidimicrobiia bacterium]|nr:2-succinyl-6-hydroxy-2,4-cyclohexadiene-1-carboxylate synthase [Acidimicrobiia bacterium]